MKSELKKYFSKIGTKGGKARLTKMTKAERRAIASLGGSAPRKKAKAKQKKVRT